METCAEPRTVELSPAPRQPDSGSVVWKANQLATARYSLSPREQKLVLYVIAMIDANDKDLREYRISVKHFAELAGLEKDNLHGQLRDLAVTIKSKPLIIENHYEAGDPKPKTLVTSWFQDAMIEANGDGYFTVTVSSKLKPYLLEVKREFIRYRLGYTVQLRSGYAIRLYEMLKRWQFRGEVTMELNDLRLAIGAAEFTPRGALKNYLLVRYHDLKVRALEPARKQIGEKCDIEFDMIENKVPGEKTVQSITFKIRAKSETPTPPDLLKIADRPARKASARAKSGAEKNDGFGGEAKAKEPEETEETIATRRELTEVFRLSDKQAQSVMARHERPQIEATLGLIRSRAAKGKVKNLGQETWLAFRDGWQPEDNGAALRKAAATAAAARASGVTKVADPEPEGWRMDWRKHRGTEPPERFAETPEDFRVEFNARIRAGFEEFRRLREGWKG